MAIGIKCLTCTKYQEPSKHGECTLGTLFTQDKEIIEDLIVQYVRRELDVEDMSNFDITVILWNCSNYTNALELWRKEDKEAKMQNNLTQEEVLVLQKLGINTKRGITT